MDTDKALGAIRAHAHGPTMDLLSREVFRGEALFKQCPPGHPNRPELLRALTLFYQQLNRMVAAACVEMGYPLRQWEWEDSKPLEAVAQAYPELGLEATEWYQRHLGMVAMMPAEPDHPWLSLTQKPLVAYEDVMRDLQ